MALREGVLVDGASGGASEPDWGILSDSVGPRMRLLRNILHARAVAVSEPFGLPTGSLTVMALIAANTGSSQALLANWAGITSPSLVGIIDELERRGLVKREKSAEDRRRNQMVLTGKGERTMVALFSEVTVNEAPIRAELSAEEMTQFVDYLDRTLVALGRAEK